MSLPALLSSVLADAVGRAFLESQTPEQIAQLTLFFEEAQREPDATVTNRDLAGVFKSHVLALARIHELEQRFAALEATLARSGAQR